MIFQWSKGIVPPKVYGDSFSKKKIYKRLLFYMVDSWSDHTKDNGVSQIYYLIWKYFYK